MKISAFVTITNPEKQQYPYIECIKSWAEKVDELVIVDGGSTDGSLKKIEDLGLKNTRVVFSKWEEDWKYSRVGQNFNVGFEECSGDVILKLDADWVLHQNSDLRDECNKFIDSKKLIMTIAKKNFILSDRYYIKNRRSIGINMIGYLERFKETPINIGFDLKEWSWGNEFIFTNRKENDCYFGSLIRDSSTEFKTSLDVFNYDNVFKDFNIARDLRLKFFKAEKKQKELKYKYIEQPTFEVFREVNEKNVDIWMEINYRNILKKFEQTIIKIDQHPGVIIKRIKELDYKKQGFNNWGFNSITSKYYEKN